MDDQLKQWVSLGREHYERHDFDKAENYFLKVLDRCDTYADVHNMMGVIYHDRGSLEAARHHFERAFALNPNYTEAALNLVVTYNDLKRYEDGQRIYNHILIQGRESQDPIEPFAKGKIANLHAEVATAYLEVGMFDQASQELRKAISLCPQFADLRLMLANVYRRWGELVAARLELEEAVRVKPSYIPARIALGVVLLSLGHEKKAMEQWEEVINLDPNNKSAQMYMRLTSYPPSISSKTEPNTSGETEDQ